MQRHGESSRDTSVDDSTSQGDAQLSTNVQSHPEAGRGNQGGSSVDSGHDNKISRCSIILRSPMRVEEVKTKCIFRKDDVSTQWLPVLSSKAEKPSNSNYAVIGYVKDEHTIDVNHRDSKCKAYIIIRTERKRKINEQLVSAAESLGGQPVYFIHNSRRVKEFLRLLCNTNQTISFTVKNPNKSVQQHCGFFEKAKSWWPDRREATSCFQDYLQSFFVEENVNAQSCVELHDFLLSINEEIELKKVKPINFEVAFSFLPDTSERDLSHNFPFFLLMYGCIAVRPQFEFKKKAQFERKLLCVSDYFEQSSIGDHVAALCSSGDFDHFREELVRLFDLLKDGCSQLLHVCISRHLASPFNILFWSSLVVKFCECPAVTTASRSPHQPDASILGSFMSHPSIQHNHAEDCQSVWDKANSVITRMSLTLGNVRSIIAGRQFAFDLQITTFCDTNWLSDLLCPKHGVKKFEELKLLIQEIQSISLELNIDFEKLHSKIYENHEKLANHSKEEYISSAGGHGDLMTMKERALEFLELFFIEDTLQLHCEQVYHQWISLILKQVSMSQYESFDFLQSLLSSKVGQVSEKFILQEVLKMLNEDVIAINTLLYLHGTFDEYFSSDIIMKKLTEASSHMFATLCLDKNLWRNSLTRFTAELSEDECMNLSTLLLRQLQNCIPYVEAPIHYILDLAQIDDKSCFFLRSGGDNVHEFLSNFMHNKSLFVEETFQGLLQVVSSELEPAAPQPLLDVILNVFLKGYIIHTNLCGEKECSIQSVFALVRNSILSEHVAVKYLCWRFIESCCEMLTLSRYSKFVSESIANKYCGAVILLCQAAEVAMSSSVEETSSDTRDQLNDSSSFQVQASYIERIRQLSDVYRTWIEVLQSIFQTWKEKLSNEELVIDDALALKNHQKYIIAAAAGGVDVSRTVVNNTYEEFKQYFKILCHLLVPKVPMRNGSERCVMLQSLLESYQVSVPNEIQLKIRALLVLGEISENDAVVLHADFSLAHRCIEETDVTIHLRSEKHLKELKQLASLLQIFLQPIECYKDLWIGLSDCPVFLKYVESIAMEEGFEGTPIHQLADCLNRTKNLLSHILTSEEVTYYQITVDENLKLEDLEGNLAQDFDKINSVIVGERIEQSSLQGVKAMASLFQAKPLICSVITACNNLDMTGCTNDESFQVLLNLYDCMNTRDGKANLTAMKANEFMEFVRITLHYDQILNYLTLFQGVANAETFHKFVQEEFCSSDRNISAAVESFQGWHQVISTQLQNEEFGEELLQQLSHAFNCIVPFLDKEQTLEQLLSKVLLLDPHSNFLELGNVSDNMHHIKRWSNQAEGEVTAQNVQEELERILTSGCYSVKQEYGRSFQLKLEFGGSAVTSDDSVVWYGEDISDFEQKLALLDSREENEGHIDRLLQWNQTGRKMLQALTDLYEFGYTAYKDLMDKTKLYPSQCELREAKDFVEDLEKKLSQWNNDVTVAYQKYPWLLFLSVRKVTLLINSDLSSGEETMRKVSFLFRNVQDVRVALRYHSRTVWTTMNSASLHEPITSMNVLGDCLNNLIKLLSGNYVVPLPNRVSDHFRVGLAFGFKLHSAWHCGYSKLIALLVQLKGGVPESYDILKCDSDITKYDLQKFFGRAKQLQKSNRPCFILEANKLIYNVQEVLVSLYQETQQVEVNMHIIETAHSLLREVPGIEIIEYKDDDLIMSFHHSREVLEESGVLDCIDVQLVYGLPGVGKSHYIRKKLSCAAQSVVISVNELFTREKCIDSLNKLTYVKNCAIYFNFTTTYPGNSAHKAERLEYMSRTQTLSWFFFELLLVGYVEDCNAGVCFHFPEDLDWTIYIEVPSEPNYEEALERFISEDIPVFGLIGKKCVVRPDMMYDIDDDARLVYDYLQAYKSGRINSLYNKEMLSQIRKYKLEIPLRDGLSKDDFMREISRHGITVFHFNIQHNLFQAYETGRLKLIVIQGDVIRFRKRYTNDTSRVSSVYEFLSDRECWSFLYNQIPTRLQTNKVLQMLFIRYMARRCEFLEKCAGFYLNGGLGSGLQTNSVLLGSTLIEVMIQEAVRMSENFDYQHSRKNIMQLIYDFEVTEVDATVGFICSDIDRISKDLKDSLIEIGVKIPTDQRALKEREFLDEALSRAIGVPLDKSKRIILFDESQYVLTLDFAIKMLNIHERRKCKIPVIIEGETGVGKTALIEMLSKLWNARSIAQFRNYKMDILESIKQEIVTRLGELPKFIKEHAINTVDPASVKYHDVVEFCLWKSDAKPVNMFCIIKEKLCQCVLSHYVSVIECPLKRGDVQDLQLASTNIPDLYSKILEDDCSLTDVATFMYLLWKSELRGTFHKKEIHAGVTARDLMNFFESDVISQAHELTECFGRNPPIITVYLDEVNTASCLAVIKEVIIDHCIDGKELPSNVFIIAACNPHRGDSTAATHAFSDILSTSYYVRKMHPTMKLLKWSYGALDEDQERDYIRAKFKLLRSIDETPIGTLEEETFSEFILNSQTQIRRYVYNQLKEYGLKDHDAATRSGSCVSQRDIQRVFIFYSWLLKSYENGNYNRSILDKHRQAILVSLGLVYFMRLPFKFRKMYIEHVDSSRRGFSSDLKFHRAVSDELRWYVENVVLPPGIAKTEALKENILATILCCVTKVPLIIEGAPGTSKTLSFNIVMANLKGSGSKMKLFQDTSLYPSLEPQFYQCSRRTTSIEIETVFKRAENSQERQNTDRSPQFSVVFMDEAGLPEQAHESLKVLHFKLEHPLTSFVAITNHPLDAAKTNRAVSVYRPETSMSSIDDLMTLANDCIGQCKAPIEQLCNGYASLMKDKDLKDFYGLRDFMYFLIYLKRNLKAQSKVESDYRTESDNSDHYIMRSLERNFGGVSPENFSKVFEYFQMPKELKQRNVTETLADSLNDVCNQALTGEHSSIQGDVRFQLIIDTSVDDSLARFLFIFNILERSSTKVFVCSSLPGDIHGTVGVISKIRHSAQKGDSVLLLHTDDVQESFYDVFNRRFRCVYIRDENRYYANISCGTHSKMSRIHPQFRCTVVLKESELKNTPIPFLNRFEKYYLSHSILLSIAQDTLPPTVRFIMKAVRSSVIDFVEMLQQRKSLYGYLYESTIDSLLLDSLSTKKTNFRPIELGNCSEFQDNGVWSMIVKVVVFGLQNICCLNIMQCESEIEEEAEDMHEQIVKYEADNIISPLMRDLPTRYRELKNVIVLVNNAFRILYSSENEALPETYLIITIIYHWLSRYYCKRLMQVLTPEGLAVHFKQIPASLRRCYVHHQSHFCLKRLIEMQQNKMHQSGYSEMCPTKLLCYTRSSTLTVKLFPTEATTRENLGQTCEYVYSRPEAVYFCQFSSRLSKHDFEKHVQDFLQNESYEVFLLVVNIEGDSKRMYQYVNHLRVIIEQLEIEAGQVKKLFVLLLLLPATQLFTSNYPCLYLRGWDLHYLDSISPNVSTSRKPSMLKISDWFSQLCIPNILESNNSIVASTLDFLDGLLDDIIPVVVSRVTFGLNSNGLINRPMPVYLRSQLTRNLFKDCDVGNVLCTRFLQYWSVETMNEYIQFAANDIYSHHSTLSLADQLQVTLHFLFANFVVYILNEINTCFGLDIMYVEADSGPELAFELENRCLLDLITEMLRFIQIPDISTISVYNGDSDSKFSLRELFQGTHCKFPLSHVVFQAYKTIVDHSRQLLLHEHKSTDVSITEYLLVNNAKKEWKQALQPSQQVFLQRIADYMDSSEEQPDISHQMCWRKYLQDFVKFELHIPSSADKVVDALAEHFYNAFKSERNVFIRFLKLHSHVSVKHLNIVRLLPTIYQLQNHGLERFLAEAQSLSVTDLFSSFITDTLYNMLSEYLSQDLSDDFDSWHKLFLQSGFSLQVASKTEVKAIIMQVVVLVKLCTIDMDSYAICKDIFLMLKEESQQCDLTIDRLLTVCKVHVADHDLPTLLEGFLEIYFGHSESKQSDFQWLLQLANESTELHPEIELFRENLPNSVIKYFLRVQMSISGSEQLVIDAFNVLQLYDSERRGVLGQTISHSFSDDVAEMYVPKFYSYMQGIPDHDTSSETLQLAPLNTPLAHTYFELVLEDLLQKTEISPVDICTKIKQINVKLSEADKTQKVLLIIEKEALIQALIQAMAKKGNPNKWLSDQTTVEITDELDDVLNERMKCERAVTYSLCLSKSISVNSMNQVVRYLIRRDGSVETFKFLDPIRTLLLDEETPRSSAHLFPFIGACPSDAVSHDLYKYVCTTMESLHFQETSSDLTSQFQEMKAKVLLNDTVEFCLGSFGTLKLTGKQAFIMLLWVCIYNNFFEKKRHSQALSTATESLKSDYPTCYIRILQSFLDPTNYAVEKQQHPNPTNFDPDDIRHRLYNHSDVPESDPIFELFSNGSDSTDYSSAALRHAMANTIAVVLALPEECNHLWYHMFRPDCLRNTFVTGFMINARISEVWHYDCGIELTSDGDYGRRYYNERISLHSQYLLLFVNFAAFCISLYTQENATVQISGPVLSPSLAVRHYCLGQLKTIWSHIQTNLGLTLEEASHLIMRTVLKFLQIGVNDPELYQGLFPVSLQELTAYEKTWQSAFEHALHNVKQECRDHGKQPHENILITRMRALEVSYPYHFINEQDLRHITEDHTISERYPVLTHFAKNLTKLQAGGALLPDLIEFYIWIHKDLKGTVSVEEAKVKSLGDIVKEFGDKHHCNLYHDLKELYARYSESIGHKVGSGACSLQRRENDLLELRDNVQLFMYLSVQDDGEDDPWEGDWIHRVIKDIMMLQSSFVYQAYDIVKRSSKHLRCYLSEPREINPLHISSHECIFGEDYSPRVHDMPLITQLLRRRWNTKSLTSAQEEIDLGKLERDLVISFLVGKPVISDHSSASLRMKYHFRASSQDPINISITLRACPFQGEYHCKLTPDVEKALMYCFHTCSFDDLYDIINGLRVIAEHINKNDDGPDQYYDQTVREFMQSHFPASEDGSDIDSLTPNGLKILVRPEQCQEHLKLSYLYHMMEYFINWVRSRYYDFCHLPLGLRTKIDEDIVLGIKTKCKRIGRPMAVKAKQVRFQKLDEMINLLKNSEHHLVNELHDICKKPLMKLLEELDVIDKEDELVRCIPASILVENYVHLQILLRELQTDCISNSISSNGKMWSEMSSEKLWSEFLGDVKQGSKLKEQIRSRSVPSTTIIMNKHRVQESAGVESSQPSDWTSVAKELKVEDIVTFLESKDVLKQCIEVFKEWEIDGVQLLQMIEDIKKHENWELMELKLPVRAKIKAHFIDYCTE